MDGLNRFRTMMLRMMAGATPVLCRLIVATIVPSAALAQASLPPSQGTPHLIATNLPGVSAYAAPPAGFDPLLAPDADLASYGFPARPTAPGGAMRNWQRMAKAARH